MKAIYLTGIHQPIQYTDVPIPTPGPGQVLIQLKAAALNHRDLFIQQGLYPKIKLPVIPGSDGAGTVVDVGLGVDAIWKGQSVVINCAMYWGSNPRFYGPDFRILGMPDNGTFAEYIAVDARYVYHKPAHLSFEQAAALPLAGLTAWRTLMTRAGLHTSNNPPEKVLITGIGGGVALFALQVAVRAGAEVWVTSGSADKLERAKALGAIGGINYHEPNWAKTLMAQTGGGRNGYFDVVVDSAGGSGFTRLIDVAAPAGRIVFYGGTTGSITDVVPARVFFKQLNILGSTMGTEHEFADMLSFVAETELVPVVDEIFPLANTEQAMQKMQAAKQFGKIVLKIAE
ncbi:zinc-binding dehydrogenase [Spirosoma sp. SC4-14]|uniref:zinc-binding dehydrogenase n=1 Tax=Spirosoma sp. SC4-14 TaxID=3128900 RepID=UPI0030D237AF